MTKHEDDDYEDIFGDLRESRSGEKILNAEQRKQLYRDAAEIHKTHGVGTEDLHYQHVLRLYYTMGYDSNITIKNNKLIIPKDLPKFKDKTLNEIEKLHSHLKISLETIHKCSENETLAAALRLADEDGRLADDISTLSALVEIADRAKRIQAQSGNRPSPDWIKRFCEVCQRYWAEHRGRGTRLRFADGSDDAGDSDFTKWVVDLFKSLKEFRGIKAQVSQLRSVAKNLPAKRGQKHRN